MKYIELKIHASSQGVEMVTEILMRNGITGISVDDPADLQDILNKKNEYGWDYIDLGQVASTTDYEGIHLDAAAHAAVAEAMAAKIREIL